MSTNRQNEHIQISSSNKSIKPSRSRQRNPKYPQKQPHKKQQKRNHPQSAQESNAHCNSNNPHNKKPRCRSSSIQIHPRKVHNPNNRTHQCKDIKHPNNNNPASKQVRVIIDVTTN